MSNRNKVSQSHLTSIFKLVSDSMEVLQRVKQGHPTEEDEFSDAVSALELFVHVSRVTMPYAKPSVVKEATTLFLVQAATAPKEG